MFIDGKRENIITLNWPFEHPLLLDTVIFGDSDSIRSEAFTTKTAYLKGTLQDIRLNDRSVMLDDNPINFNVETFGHISSSSNLLRVRISNGVARISRGGGSKN